MQSTAPHWTVMLEEVTEDTLTFEGAADGAVGINYMGGDIGIHYSPASRVNSVTVLLTAVLPAALLAVTVML